MNTKCKNCKKEISKNIKYCPYCGTKLKTNYLLVIVGILLIIIYPIGGIIFCLTLLPNEKNLKIPLIGFVTLIGIISVLLVIFLIYAFIKLPTMID